MCKVSFVSLFIFSSSSWPVLRRTKLGDKSQNRELGWCNKQHNTRPLGKSSHSHYSNGGYLPPFCKINFSFSRLPFLQLPSLTSSSWGLWGPREPAHTKGRTVLISAGTLEGHTRCPWTNRFISLLSLWQEEWRETGTGKASQVSTLTHCSLSDKNIAKIIRTGTAYSVKKCSTLQISRSLRQLPVRDC